jgi:membrane protein implicated in regulation of membrane protease activity
MELWHIWMLAAIVFCILEIFTPSFFFVCIGVGCAAAGVGALVSSTGYILQWSLFAVGAAIGFVFVRPLILKYAYRKSDKVKTNTDSLTGKTGRVTEAIDPATGAGRVNVGGDDWRAQSVDNAPIALNTRVRVVGLDGITVMVENNA